MSEIKPSLKMSVSKKDTVGSRRYVCWCGTHFNSNPKHPKSTEKWIAHHSKCVMEREYKVGDRVIYLNDFGMERAATIESDPWDLCGTKVIQLSGKPCCYVYDRIIRLCEEG